jgi:hypothetical protein
MPINPDLPRATSALLAAAVTLAMLAAFLLPGPSGLRRATPSGQMLVYARPLAAFGAAPAAPTPPARSTAAGAIRPSASAAPLPAMPAATRASAGPDPQAARREPAEPVAPVVGPLAGATAGSPAPAASSPDTNSAAAAVAAVAPARTASAPLRLDRSVVREASRASRSSVQQMAEAAGQTAGDAPVSGSERLAESVARTVKPDCLPPGGTHGLFTPFVAAYKLATDTCRIR